MLSLRLVCVGKLKERFYADAVNEYVKRLSSYCKLEIIEIAEYQLPAEPSDALIEAALDRERVAIADRLPTGFMTVALCVEGKELNSEGLSAFLMENAVRGISKVCFIIGGSYGLHPEVKNTADFRLSLSKMTLPHSLARVFLLEQLYRALNMADGGKYHK